MKKSLSFAIFFLLIFYLLNGALTYRYALDALFIWFEKLVPSMFVSMVFVRICYQLGVLRRLAKACHWFVYPIFHIDSYAFSLVIASLFLGFPTGSLFIDEEVQKGYLRRQDAKRLIQCCCFATPGFIILSCGSVLYQSTTIGIQLFFISLLTGFLLLFFSRAQAIATPPITVATPPFFHCLTKAMLDSGKALFMIGGYLMIVMSVSALFVPYLPYQLQVFIQTILEFSNGTVLISSQPYSLVLRHVLTAGLLSFGGLCVHLQIFAMCPHSSLHYWQYLGYRIVQAGMAMGIAYLVF